MLSTIKMVLPSVSDRSSNPVLQNFNFSNGRVQGFNGVFSISAPVSFDLNALPNANLLVKAMTQVGDDSAYSASVTGKTGKLSIKAKGFKALIPCSSAEYPEIKPEGEEVLIRSLIVPVLDNLQDVVSEDLTHNWANGVLLSGNYAYATNNVVVVRAKMPLNFETAVNIPKRTIAQLVKMEKEPCKAALGEKSVTFFYGDNENNDKNVWLKTALNSTEWPDVSSYFDIPENATEHKLDKSFFKSLKRMKPFLDVMQRVFIKKGFMQTSHHKTESVARFDILDETMKGCFRYDCLSFLKSIDCDKVLIDPLTGRLYFDANGYTGLMVGMRDEL